MSNNKSAYNKTIGSVALKNMKLNFYVKSTNVKFVKFAYYSKLK